MDDLLNEYLGAEDVAPSSTSMMELGPASFDPGIPKDIQDLFESFSESSSSSDLVSCHVCSRPCEPRTFYGARACHSCRAGVLQTVHPGMDGRVREQKGFNARAGKDVGRISFSRREEDAKR